MASLLRCQLNPDATFWGQPAAHFSDAQIDTNIKLQIGITPQATDFGPIIAGAIRASSNNGHSRPINTPQAYANAKQIAAFIHPPTYLDPTTIHEFEN